MIKAVVFDAYGTVVRIGDPRHPYRQLLRAHNTALAGVDMSDVMRKTTTLQVVAEMLKVKVPLEEMHRLQQELYAEVASITAYDDVAPVWEALREKGIKIGICSNLATPYIRPVLHVLPFAPDVAVWSCDVGHVKDEPEIYKIACYKLGVSPAEALMVGDTYKADVRGPREAGMQAVHLKREGSGKVGPEDGIEDLFGVLGRVFAFDKAYDNPLK